MDTATPGTRTDVSNSLVEAFEKYQKPFVDARVSESLTQVGATVREMLQQGNPHQQSTRKTPLGEYALTFCGQFMELLRRKLLLTLRNPMALGLPVAVPVIQGVIVGYMFSGTGQKDFLRQIMFSFCMLTMLCLAGTMGLIVLIND